VSRHQRPIRKHRPRPEVAAPTTLDIPLSALHLEEVGRLEPWHRLLGTLSIAGLPFVVHATAVELARGGQQPVAAGLRADFASLVAALRTEEAFGEITRIGSDGREHLYVFLIFPCDS
jgi:hypothetical protein